MHNSYFFLWNVEIKIYKDNLYFLSSQLDFFFKPKLVSGLDHGTTKSHIFLSNQLDYFILFYFILG